MNIVQGNYAEWVASSDVVTPTVAAAAEVAAAAAEHWHLYLSIFTCPPDLDLPSAKASMPDYQASF